MVFKINLLPKLSKLFIRKSTTSGLVKNDGTIDTSNYIQTSQTSGLVKNDGTIDENISTHTHGNLTNDGKVGTASDKIITTTTGGAIQASDSIVSTYIKEAKSHSNIGSSQNDNLQDVFDDIDTQLGYKISTSNTSGLVKNDGSIDTTKYLPIIYNPTIPNNSLSNIKSNGIYYIGNTSSLSDAPISDLPTICMVVEGNEDEYIKQTVFNIVTNSDVPDYRTWIRFDKMDPYTTDWIFTNWTETTVPQSISDLTGVNTNGFVLNNGSIDEIKYLPITTSSTITDCNDYKTAGVYFINRMTTNIINVPSSNSTSYGSLIVEGDGTKGIKQTYSILRKTNSINYITYVRHWDNGTNTWTDWIEANGYWYKNTLYSNTDNDGHYSETVLYINENIRMCRLYFRHYFGGCTNTIIYDWTNTYGDIPNEYTPISGGAGNLDDEIATGALWGTNNVDNMSSAYAVSGTLRVLSNGDIQGKFNENISNCMVYANVIWNY